MPVRAGRPDVLTVDRYRPADRPALYDVCLRTGDSGADASHLYEDGDLLGHVFLGAYLALEPGLARVLRRQDGSAVGYCVATADTRAFEERCEHAWWPELRSRYDAPTDDDESPDAGMARLIHHPPRTDGPWLPEFPAHLHVDLLPEAQGGGHGRRILEKVLDAVAQTRAPGVHLGVSGRNARAVGFYEHLGFAVLERGPEGMTMGMTLPRR
ncbi:GNAT family N-acetyltransferase [Georgenia sp. H159]|uniref:GNAT family N-acetyltransferase n=1 Tax=Georgenia sp. H159 TaxID=3076115 RepID=UPI002D796F1E|nr:GNAT family N-acetyltransferase [Georgenia sp. H159]